MEKIYISEIRNAETNELLVKVSSFSQEGLEEEMGKQKWLKFAEDRPDILAPEELSEEDMESAEVELEADKKADLKMEEDPTYPEDDEDMLKDN